MILYHGSYTAVMNPAVNFGRKEVDFGQGFYLTRLKGQATKWAKFVAGRKPGQKAVLNTYALDLASVTPHKYRFKIFKKYDLDWLAYVVDCRNGGRLQKKYDLVEGGVANDNVIDTVEDFENGIITSQQALGQLRYKKINHQICIHNQEIVDKYLHFKRAIII